MRKDARIIEASFLSKNMVLVTMRTDGGNVSATCSVPWFLRTIGGLRDLGIVDLDVPVHVDLGSGKEIKEVLIRMDEEFRLRDVMTVLDVMRS